MTKHVNMVTLRLGKFVAWRLEHVSRNSKEKADALAVVATSLPINATMLLSVYYQQESSITTNRVNEVDKACPSWMTPIVCYLSSGKLPDDKAKAHKTQVKAARFSLVNDQLKKWCLDGPYLKCLTHQQGRYVLAKLYDRVCKNHPGSRTLAYKAHTQGHYWPTMSKDAIAYVKMCDRC